MSKNSVTLNEAVRFHGHLGPWLILGVLAGELALKKLKAKKYFDLEVKIWGADRRPRSCLIDGLQLSTGATYGKGNICKFNSSQNIIRIVFVNKKNNKKLILRPKDKIIRELDTLVSHQESEYVARKLYKKNPLELFELISKN